MHHSPKDSLEKEKGKKPRWQGQQTLQPGDLTRCQSKKWHSKHLEIKCISNVSKLDPEWNTGLQTYTAPGGLDSHWAADEKSLSNKILSSLKDRQFSNSVYTQKVALGHGKRQAVQLEHQ